MREFGANCARKRHEPPWIVGYHYLFKHFSQFVATRRGWMARSPNMRGRLCVADCRQVNFHTGTSRCAATFCRQAAAGQMPSSPGLGSA